MKIPAIDDWYVSDAKYVNFDSKLFASFTNIKIVECRLILHSVCLSLLYAGSREKMHKRYLIYSSSNQKISNAFPNGYDPL